MPDYSKGKIYKIIDNTNGNIYIGSTTQPLSKRLTDHKADLKKKYCCSSFEIIKNDNYSIILIEEVNCENKEQLLRAERYHIENNDCINKNIPFRKNKEYYEKNKEQLLEKNKEYYEKNKEQLLEKAKEFYQKNKEQILEYKKQYNQKKKLGKINIVS